MTGNERKRAYYYRHHDRILAERRRDYPTRKHKKWLTDKGRRNSLKLRAVAAKGGLCLDCGFSFTGREECAQFDHLPQHHKTANLAELLKSSWQKAEPELEKVELVCANCHAIRTRRRANGFTT